MTVHSQGTAVTLRALIDTGAQAWLLADRYVCNDISKTLSLDRHTFDQPISIQGFADQPDQQV